MKRVLIILGLFMVFLLGCSELFEGKKKLEAGLDAKALAVQLYRIQNAFSGDFDLSNPEEAGAAIIASLKQIETLLADPEAIKDQLEVLGVDLDELDDIDTTEVENLIDNIGNWTPGGTSGNAEIDEVLNGLNQEDAIEIKNLIESLGPDILAILKP